MSYLSNSLVYFPLLVSEHIKAQFWSSQKNQEMDQVKSSILLEV